MFLLFCYLAVAFYFFVELCVDYNSGKVRRSEFFSIFWAIVFWPFFLVFIIFVYTCLINYLKRKN